MNSKLKVGIIGSNGFLGRHLSEQLVTNKQIEKLLLFGRSDKHIDIKNSKKIKYIKIDLQSRTSYTQSVIELDIIFYLASSSIPASTWNNPLSELNENFIPFLNFLETIKNTNVKKIIYTSSAGTIYGPSINNITEDSITKPFNPHGIVKLSMEHFLEYYRINYNLNYEVFRISNIFGPNQITSKGLGLITTLLENYHLNKITNIYGDGNIMRNYIYIKDVINVLEKSILFNLKTSNTINLVSNDNVTINELIKIIESSLKDKLLINNIEPRSSDNPNISLSNSKLLSMLPDLNFTLIESAIEETNNSIKTIK
jgi:UDP-glucose 4-epimerase